MQNSYSSGFQPEMPSRDERTIALMSHILTFVAPLLAPLVIYLVKKDQSAYIAHHAKESLNFQITLILAFILLFISLIGIFFLWLVGIAGSVLVVLATVKAGEGVWYRYPFCLRLIK